jgi:hypothetical protein
VDGKDYAMLPREVFGLNLGWFLRIGVGVNSQTAVAYIFSRHIWREKISAH